MSDDEVRPQTPPGPGVDATGQAVIDPTKNVLYLVTAAIARQDDLREQESAHVREMMAIRAEFARELRKAETDRIDAIRAVDVGAVNRAAEVAATQATTLASQVAVSAETLRTQVAAAASAASIALAAALEPVQKDIADLRRAQYEAQGKTAQVVETRGTGASVGLWIGLAVGIAALFLSLIVTVVVVFVAIKP
jgi:hypothetical protein